MKSFKDKLNKGGGAGIGASHLNSVQFDISQSHMSQNTSRSDEENGKNLCARQYIDQKTNQ